MRPLRSRSNHSGMPGHSRKTIRSRKSITPNLLGSPGQPNVNFQSREPPIQLAILPGLVILGRLFVLGSLALLVCPEGLVGLT